MIDSHAEELSRLRAEAGLPVLMSHQEVVNWVAFQRVSPDDLTDLVAFGVKWAAAYNEDGSKRPAELSEDATKCPLLNALHALAQGTPVWTPRPERSQEWQALVLKPPHLDFTPPAFLEVEHAAKDLVERLKRNADDLAKEMQADLRAYAVQKAKVSAAEQGLQDAEVEGLIKATGRWPELNYRGIDVIRLWPARNDQTTSPRRTGVAGRPTSKALAIEKMRLRAAQGLLAPTLTKEAAGEGKIRLLKNGRSTLVDMASVRAFLASLPDAKVRSAA